ncbi:hypothetical protein Bca101_010283 [Brassica carinata]
MRRIMTTEATTTTRLGIGAVMISNEERMKKEKSSAMWRRSDGGLSMWNWRGRFKGGFQPHLNGWVWSSVTVARAHVQSCLSFEAAHLNGLGIAGSAQFKSGLTTGSRLRSAVTTASLFVIEPEPPLLRLSPSASPPFPLTPVTPPRHGSVRKPYISLDLSFLCVVMDLRFSSGLGKSDGSRYGNIRVLFLSWISVCVPLWIRVKSIVSSRRRLYYTPDIEAALSHQGFYGAKLHRLNLSLLVTAGSIVQECCFARFSYDYLTVASLSHYDVSSIDGSSQSRICGIPDLLVAGTIVKKCGLARITYNYITAVTPSHYAVSSIDSSSQSQLCNLQTGVVARRPYHPEAFYLLSNVCSYTFRLNECNDCMLRFPLVINYWARHGNVEFRGLDPIKQSAMSSNSILSVSLEVKLELEIHLVSSASLVGFKADCACFSIISSQIGLYTLSIFYGSGASHLNFLPTNIPTSSYRCINVVFDYQLFFRTIAMGTKVELPFGFLHFAEHDSPLYGSIFRCFVMLSSFILPSSMSPGSSASVVNSLTL